MALRRRICRAFTLMEVLIAIALTTALLGAMFGFLFTLLDTRDEAARLSTRQRAANVLLQRLERDLLTCLVGDDRLGAGVQGDATSLRLLTRGVALSSNYFRTSNAITGAFRDVQRVEYRFDESRRRIEAGRAVDSRTAPDFEDLGADFFRVRLRYYDGSGWSETFDSLAADRLPQAVELSIWFDPWPGEATELEVDEDAPFDEFSNSRPSRTTFDETAGFDEIESARLSDLPFDDEPTPDRRRIILIPDSEGDGA